MNPVLRAAGNYCAFIETTAKSDTEFLEEVEGLLLDLYAMATRLEWPNVQHDSDVDDQVSPVEMNSIMKRIGAGIGRNHLYWEVFDPFAHDDRDPVCGDLVDDLGDIYLDTKRALMAHEDAMWQLKFGFDYHWGRHAIGALMAIFHLLRRS